MISINEVEIKVLGNPEKKFTVSGVMQFKNEIERNMYIDSLQNHFEYWLKEDVEIEIID